MRGRGSKLACLIGLVTICTLALAPSASAAPRCATSRLAIWMDASEGGGTAGGFYYQLAFTNFSGHACAMHGAPSVVPVDVGGHRLGSWVHGSGSGATVLIPNRGTARAQLKAVDPGVFSPAECLPVLAAGLRVRPPGQLASRLVPFPLDVCSKPGHPSLEVWEVKPG